MFRTYPRLIVALATALLLAGCGEGFPTPDSRTLPPQAAGLCEGVSPPSGVTLELREARTWANFGRQAVDPSSERPLLFCLDTSGHGRHLAFPALAPLQDGGYTRGKAHLTPAGRVHFDGLKRLWQGRPR